MPDLTFTVDSALLSELGEKLVEKVHIALLELVKNAYDADATEVTVRILAQPSGGPEIHVVDNGSGMTLADVRQYWMKIATTHKLEKDVSPRFGRPRAGSKGIGRFSCRRLGNHLRLITVARNDADELERTEVIFPWEDFRPGAELTDVKCSGETDVLSEGETGTQLVISKASQDEWTRRGYNYLKRQIAVLVANRGARREGFEEDPGFDVILEAAGLDETKVVNLREELLWAGWGTLAASVDKDGRAICELDAQKIGRKQIRSAARFPRLCGVALEVGILPDRREHMRDTGVLSLGTLGNILNTWGGVHVHYKGFRVYPYGDPGDDWLEIDRDRARRKVKVETSDLFGLADQLQGVDPRRVLLSLLSNRNYVGDVEIPADAEAFETKASREGFVGEEPIRELKEFVRYAIDWSTIYRDFFLRLLARERSEEARQQLEETVSAPIPPVDVVDEAADYIEKEVSAVASELPTKQRQRVQKGIRTATDAIRQRDRANRQELRHLRLVASTSSLLLVFSHEVHSFIGTIAEQSLTLENLKSALPVDLRNRIEQMQSSLDETKDRFVGLLRMTRLIGTESREAETAELAIRPRLEEAVGCYKPVLDKYDISVQGLSAIPENRRTGSMLEAELYAVVLNALSNAIKAVVAAGKPPRKIAFALEQRGDACVLHIRDNGIGLPEEHYEDAFVPFLADPSGELYAGLDDYSDAEDADILGTGSGLGLSIVREILQDCGGTARFVEPVGNWATDLEITFP